MTETNPPAVADVDKFALRCMHDAATDLRAKGRKRAAWADKQRDQAREMGRDTASSMARAACWIEEAAETLRTGAVPDTGDACQVCAGSGVEVHGGSSNPDSPDHYAPAEEPCTGCYGSGSRKYREGWDDALAGRGAGPAVPDTGQAREPDDDLAAFLGRPHDVNPDVLLADVRSMAKALDDIAHLGGCWSQDGQHPPAVVEAVRECLAAAPSGDTVQAPDAECYCCSCTHTWDAACRNHGAHGTRACRKHNLPGAACDCCDYDPTAVAP